MSTRARHIWLMIVTQAGCVAVGLWMQHRFVVASVARASVQQVWSDIEAGAESVFSKFTESESGDTTIAGSASDRLTRLLAGDTPSLGDVMIVDPTWRVIFATASVARAATDPASPGQLVTWAQFGDAPLTAGDWARGRMSLSDGTHVAVARTLPGGQGYMVVHYPLATIEAMSTALVESLPAVSAMTLVWMCVLLSIAAYMIVARLHDEIDSQRSRSAHETLRQSQSLIRTRDAVIFGLAKLAESRDPETGDHLERISVYSRTLAAALHRDPKFHDQVTPTFVRLIGISSALHDIGKVGIEDRILLKPGPLTSEEREIMEVHSTIGGECLRDIEQRLGSSNFLQLAREIAFSHHENWDGTGYPYGLAGSAIPLSGRIVTIADVYDALSCKRVYKEPFAHERCAEIILSESGKKFDPDIIEVWKGIEPKFRAIAQQLSDAARVSAPRDPTAVAIDECSGSEIEEFCAVSSGASSGRA